jgi:hypothetical protein
MAHVFIIIISCNDSLSFKEYCSWNSSLHHKLLISQIFNKIGLKIVKQYVCAKSMGFKMKKWHEKYIHYFYINDFFCTYDVLMQVHTIYILTKFVQLS